MLVLGSDIWGSFKTENMFCNLTKPFQDCIEKCQMHFIRYAVGFNRKAPNIGMVGETGRLPQSIEAVINSIKNIFYI